MISNPSREFPLEAGLAVQRADLAKWKAMLNPTIYGALEKFCQESNARIQHPKAKDAGYDVVRGDALTDFAINYGNRIAASPAIREGID